MSQDQNLTRNIAIPKNNLEILRINFPQCFDKNGDFDFDKFQKELANNEINFSKESYGMDWLGKSYARLLATDPAKTLVKEDKDWNSKVENKNSENLLIKGDNLEVLKHLSNAYHEKVKMIYIDPPYNTGSDGFVYEDDRKFTAQELSELAGVDEEQANKILSFINSKSNSHSAWLTFMYPRLYIAKQLLKDDGAIFVSIDDNEVAQLRILMDEIFGEENFEGHIHWRRRHNQPNDKSKMLGLVAEHILVYAKNSSFLKKVGVGKLDLTGIFSNSDNDTRGDWASKPWKTGDDQSGTKYEITTPTGIIYNEEWMGEKSTFEKLLADNRITFTKNGDGLPRKKYFRLEREEEGQCASNWWIHELFGNNQKANDETTQLFGEKNIFSNPKPCDLLKGILRVGNTASDDLILDFFAGSGTTGDAVMQLNAEDKANGKEGNRKYILVQIPERIDVKKNKTAYDFVMNELGVDEPTIFEITKERLVRAGKKIQLEQKEKSTPLAFASTPQEGNLDLGFKIFETQPIWEDYEFQAKEFDAQIKLFDESKLSSDDLQTLLTTWKTYDNIPLTVSLETVNLDGYTGYYGNARLYLMDKGFETKHLKALLNKIDEDTTFNPVSIIVFGYHFESKALREIAENVSSYANKKKLDIDFITRY